MALRIRSDGRVLCAAMHGAEPGDTYIDDQLAYSLSAEHRVLGTEPMDLPDGGGHASHGQWWWMGNVPDGIQIAPSYLIPLSAKLRYADEVEEGDRIEWCGLLLEVKGVTSVMSGLRSGRHFLVMIDDARRFLHYFDAEIVRTVPSDALAKAPE